MKVTTENIAAGTVTTAPEELQALTDKLIEYRATLAVLRSLDLSPATHHKCVAKLNKRMGFGPTSIFAETA